MRSPMAVVCLAGLLAASIPTPVSACDPLPDEVVQRVADEKTPTLIRCYRQALKRNDGLAGDIELGWTIRPNGSVGDVRVENSSLENPEAEQCMARQLATWRFPRNRGKTEVTWTWGFEP